MSTAEIAMADALARITPHAAAHMEGLPTIGLPYLLATARAPGDRRLLLLAHSDERTETLAATLGSFGCSDVAVLTGQRHVAFAAAAPDPEIVFAQSALRFRLIDGSPPDVLVISASALFCHWPPEAEFLAHHRCWRVGEETPQEKVPEHLIRCGYRRVNLAEDAGTFSTRGSIVDIFVPGARGPLRLDFFGDELASVHLIDLGSQRPVSSQDEVHITPIREVIFTDENVARAHGEIRRLAEHLDIPTRRLRELASEIDQRNYFYGIEALWPLFYNGSESIFDAVVRGLSRDLRPTPTAGSTTGPPLLVVDDSNALAEAGESRWQQLANERQRALERFELVADAEQMECSPEALQQRIQCLPRLTCHSLFLSDRSNSGPTTAKTLPHSTPATVNAGTAVPAAAMPSTALPHALNDWRDLARELQLRRSDPGRGEILDPVVDHFRSHLRQTTTSRFFFACHSRGSAERLRELLLGRDIDLPIVEGLSRELVSKSRCLIAVAPLPQGLTDRHAELALLTDVEIFGKPTRARPKAKRAGAPDALSTLRDLRPEDHVIHVDHGIGLYHGLKRLILNGVDGDYIHLEYAGGDSLYIPVYNLAVLQRAPGSAEGVKLDKLGGNRWQRTKQRVKDTVLAVAHKLLALQATRKTQRGLPCKAADEHFRTFEASFPHEETADQQAAIDAVLGDLAKDLPMDRLVCGDVGFGKTEVAVRAAYLAILSGYQAAVLVPTTVLAEQHGETFRERLQRQGVEVEVLSRFRSAKDARAILDRCKDGRVDLLIGTHRLLSPDVGFKNLGLLVVDEEQRFGVRNKERIKELRARVHVLTLSATPIPRTLHMAMMGLRDLSIISTPPSERSAIHTEVTRYHEDIVQQAIRAEHRRGGQVFFVHNRVQSIAAMAETLAGLVPEAKIGVAHGQMSSTQLEKIMVRFIRRDFNVLLCTAIIESGIDIPSANTLIVHRADTFGLAQLHQLRGRIGRSKERAYAFMLLPRSEKLTKIAAERLGVLKRFSDLGAGFSIANHDLDIRGAGDLLGEDQSGNIAAVGFELYMELLDEAVRTAEGQRASGTIEPDIKLPVSAVLPEKYLPDPVRRIEYYQRMSAAGSDEEIFDICSEVESRYGPAPEEVMHLAEVMVIRRRLKELGVLALSAAVVKPTKQEPLPHIRLGLMFVADAPIDRVKLTALLQEQPKKFRLLPSGRLLLTRAKPVECDDALFLRLLREELGALVVHLRANGQNPQEKLAQGVVGEHQREQSQPRGKD